MSAAATPMETLLKRFQSFKPPTLTGTENAIDCENWLEDIEQFLEALDYTDDRRVKLIVHQLHGLVDWAVKMRIRPPEFETSICDAKYHVSLLRPPPSSLTKPSPAPPSAAAAASSPEIRSGQLDEENPSVQISSGLLVQADEGVSFLVVDRIGVFYRSLTLEPPRRRPTARIDARDACTHGWRFLARRAKISALDASCLRDKADGWRRVMRGGDWPMNAGLREVERWLRALAARLPHEWRPEDAGCLRTLADRLPLDCAALLLLLRTGCACFSTMVARNLHTALRRAWRGVARAAARNFLRGGGAAGRPPLRRCSGDGNITMFPTNETWYFASQILVSNSGGLILILTAQSTRNMFRIHSDY
ncbi:hypothetical protein F511_33067 [Dorcoceras hygrometricum]|uniref:Uncharacterized protein n=1 Tax=Dorcoceras hygrometricum TaxID=472368 RepID=A0A2Z7BBG4_9LAMI|nr:hypothetical protein F511_33067 [Dorcoceras hygrometricum]